MTAAEPRDRDGERGVERDREIGRDRGSQRQRDRETEGQGETEGCRDMEGYERAHGGPLGEPCAGVCREDSGRTWVDPSSPALLLPSPQAAPPMVISAQMILNRCRSIY